MHNDCEVNPLPLATKSSLVDVMNSVLAWRREWGELLLWLRAQPGLCHGGISFGHGEYWSVGKIDSFRGRRLIKISTFFDACGASAFLICGLKVLHGQG